MKVFVLNCGSSSVKYSVFEMEKEKKLAFGTVEKIGTAEATIYHQKLGNPAVSDSKLKLDYSEAMKRISGFLVDPKYGVMKDVDDLDAVGHRVVHGGDRFVQPVVIDKDVVQELIALFPLAPLHNPPNVKGIKWAQRLFPKAVQVAVFDTSFYQRMPKRAYMYGLPKEISQKHGIRKYGFHGISHAYVAEQAASFLKKEISALKMITCHIGNGVSITAISGGIPLDTSMGFTPLEGVMMGTRSGSIDPAIIPFLEERTGQRSAEVVKLLNEKSGLLGVSGISHDLRELVKAIKDGNEDAKLAIDIYVYQLVKMIGSFLPVLGGLDVLVFTAGVGEHVPLIRKRICDAFCFLGMDIREEQEQVPSSTIRRISTPESKVEILVVPTNEEWMIAMQTKALVEGKHPC